MQRGTFRYPFVTVTFDKATGRASPVRPRGMRWATKPHHLPLRLEHEALRQVRQRQTTPEFAAL